MSEDVYIYVRTEEALYDSVVRRRQTKKIDGRKKEPEILPFYYY
jgi:hypothetical protein